MLSETFETKKRKGLFFAGQMTGVEGYVESAASGIVAGINAARHLEGKEQLVFPTATATGALGHYIATFSGADFQPMNINFGIIDGLAERIKNKRERYAKISQRALTQMNELIAREL